MFTLFGKIVLKVIPKYQLIMEATELLNKTCLLGISYFDFNGDLMGQVQYAGEIVNIDAKQGISLSLFETSPANHEQKNQHKGDDNIFVIPSDTSSFFVAPKGIYRNSENELLIENPDFFVVWDVYRMQDKKIEQGIHEWWDWRPQTMPPKVN